MLQGAHLHARSTEPTVGVLHGRGYSSCTECSAARLESVRGGDLEHYSH